MTRSHLNCRRMGVVALAGIIAIVAAACGQQQPARLKLKQPGYFRLGGWDR